MEKNSAGPYCWQEMDIMDWTLSLLRDTKANGALEMPAAKLGDLFKKTSMKGFVLSACVVVVSEYVSQVVVV
ncbi:unnamed protein product [Citrullus colocynthis]|uniref:Uncharacterized protein n=1 Tax=Citrullus colocynthis TaxID=252529 RepID=A0ABP0XPT8_9ROSI